MSRRRPIVAYRRIHRRVGIGALAALALSAAPVAASSWTLDAIQWAAPRSGAAILSMPPLDEVVAAWSRAEQAEIVIRHAGGAAGELWAAELEDWLIALGIPGSAIRTLGGGEPRALRLEVSTRRP